MNYKRIKNGGKRHLVGKVCLDWGNLPSQFAPDGTTRLLIQVNLYLF